jgi:hypothetical protein
LPTNPSWFETLAIARRLRRASLRNALWLAPHHVGIGASRLRYRSVLI